MFSVLSLKNGRRVHRTQTAYIVGDLGTQKRISNLSSACRLSVRETDRRLLSRRFLLLGGSLSPLPWPVWSQRSASVSLPVESLFGFFPNGYTWFGSKNRYFMGADGCWQEPDIGTGELRGWCAVARPESSDLNEPIGEDLTTSIKSASLSNSQYEWLKINADIRDSFSSTGTLKPHQVQHPPSAIFLASALHSPWSGMSNDFVLQRLFNILPAF
ncbi:hypothetical protein LX32DRAFT_435945 [Colletotrichum zoysiae]|uniref:Uncharacterized protein n=1 Tax=Colletotrichum zoysiae TaxID=1216348 RepID=A0AAD9LYT1_9PEZI|nr:hypothetical protein LX32DRAFT_435945 [Colletotrichum zoysiae]